MTNGEILAALWSWAKREGVDHIVYHSPINDSEVGVEGWFHPEVMPLKRPQTWLFRSRQPQPHDEPDRVTRPLFDAITLSHEYGHFRSWKDSARGQTPEWQAYFAAAMVRDEDAKKVSFDQAKLIMTEEQRAWDLGHVALSALSFTDWSEFERRREIGVRGHRVNMGLESEGTS